jgi:c(7)-type cytochrome triheme protein
MRRARPLALAAGALAALGVLALAGSARAMQLPIPHEYGHVVLANGTGRARVPPVGFDHWSHRSQFTCRLCHVDLGFAMAPGASQVTAASNRDGYHCGACHDGKRAFKGKVLFAACSDATRIEPGSECVRCHARFDSARALKAFEPFAQRLPRDRFGLVDWEKAEAAGLVKPVDFLEGVSIARDPLKNKREITIASKGSWMSNVLFSHPKHAVWNGCEVCHPDIFPNTGGQRRYTMLTISSGEACGACHDKVAFPLASCEKCHVNPVH